MTEDTRVGLSDGPVILFDGVCNLCNATVRFVLKRDARHRFKFAHLQSDTGQQVSRTYGLPTSDFTSVILISDGNVHLKSSAMLRIASKLDGMWPLLAVFLAVPRVARDAAYDFVGKRRYRLFGRLEACAIPEPKDAERFLK